MNKLYCWLLALMSSLELAGCHSQRAECVLITSDFEQFEGWVTPLPTMLSTERAHSGRYSVHLADGAEFTPSHLSELSKCDFVPRRLHLTAWVYAPSNRIGTTGLVVEVNCHGRRPNIWKSLDIDQVVRRYQKWEQVQKYISLPADIEPLDEIKVYMWHMEHGGENVWLDDLKLTGER